MVVATDEEPAIARQFGRCRLPSGTFAVRRTVRSATAQLVTSVRVGGYGVNDCGLG